MKKFRWAVVGCGQAAHLFCEGMGALGSELYALHSKTEERAALFCKRFGIKRLYGSYRSLLEDPLVDIVYLATPHPLHCEQGMQALKSGKHLLVEKPFAMNGREAKELFETAKELSLYCMEANWMHFIPAMRRAIDVVESGKIGELHMITASLGHPIIADESHRLLNPLLGGGALMDLGVYPLSIAYRLMGAPQEVSSFFSKGKTGVDEEVITALQYGGGKLASVACSLKSALPNECFIMGKRATLHIHAPLYRPTKYSVIPLTPLDFTQGSSTSGGGLIASLPLLYKALRLLKAKLFSNSKSYSVGFKGNGYHYEALEAENCLREGKQESAILPPSQTIGVMELLDRIRSKGISG